MGDKGKGQRDAVKVITLLARESNWPIDMTVKELTKRCDVTLLRAHRLAHQWTLSEVAQRIREQLTGGGPPKSRLGHHRVSRWETGEERPSARYLDALCRLYRTRPDRLGFGVDCIGCDKPDNCNSSFAEPSSDLEVSSSNGVNGQGWSRMERRDVIRRLLATAGFGISTPALQALDQTRDHMAELFQRRAALESTIDWWEAQVARHGSAYRAIPATQLLGAAVLDFDDIQQVLEIRQNLDNQRRLTWATARLAGLIGVLCIDLGEPGQASRWFHVGHIAAQEINDRTLQAWLRTREALVSLYYSSPEHAAHLARSARHLAGATKSIAAAMAPAVEARALARIGRERESIAAIRYSIDAFATIPDSIKNDGVFGFGEHKLRFYEGNVLARTDKTSKPAIQAQNRALSLYATTDLVDRSHIYLDRAMCLLRSGDLVEACNSTSRVLSQLPTDTGIGAVIAEAQEIRLAVPSQHTSHASVRELDELIITRRADLAAT